MTSIEILFTSVGFIAGVVGVMLWHFTDLNKRFAELKNHTLEHDKCFATVENNRLDDLCKLAALEQRVRVLEEQMSGLLMVSEVPKFPDLEDEEIVI